MKSLQSCARKGAVLSLVIAVLSLLVLAQTPIKLHGNKFSPADDVKLGREAAGEAEKKLQIVNDAQLGSYIDHVGQRLAAGIPPEFQHSEFQYTFKVVQAKEINAFALPGGPMYVNTGMIEAAKTEAEMAGVMAHEISHVALRHGTAQATKASKYNTLSSILGMGGQVLGGPIGTAAQMGAQGVGVYFLKFSREYETEADLLGARIMANAGYDPRDLANMFQTIEKQGGSGGPSFLSDHPSPKDRYAKINHEAELLKVNTAATPDTADFLSAKQRLSGGNTGQLLANNSKTPNEGSAAGLAAPTGHAEKPSTHYRAYDKTAFTIGVPDNWREVSSQNGTWFAPNGGYGSTNNQVVFTHAINVGVAQTHSKTAQQASDEFVKQIARGNNLKARGGYEELSLNGHPGSVISFDNVNEATGKPELVHIVTAQLRNGSLFYLIAVSPTDEFSNYQNTFSEILRSIKFKD